MSKIPTPIFLQVFCRKFSFFSLFFFYPHLFFKKMDEGVGYVWGLGVRVPHLSLSHDEEFALF